MKFGPELPYRLQLARERKQLVSEHGEEYSFMSGEYRQPFYDDDIIPPDPEVHKLYGAERQLFLTIVQLAQTNQASQAERPTIMLDIGGMAGLSMMRIATQPALRRQIEQGQVVVLVSNLGFDMAAEVNRPAHKRLDFLLPEQAWFVLMNRHLVKYIKGDAAALLRQHITMPDGRVLALRGNVDLVHEHYTLIHGQKNDLDIPRLGKLVSPVGELWLGSSADHLELSQDGGQYDPRLQAARQEAHRFGVDNLSELGLQAKPTQPYCGYQIFSYHHTIN